jgi:fructose-specific component phosphotransferase system IIB-like protein
MTDQPPDPTAKPTNRGRRIYTDAEKLQAVMAAEVLGAAAVRKSQGIPKRTLPKYQKHTEKSLDDIADGFKVIMAMAQEALISQIPNMGGRDLTILLGVSTDKHQLLTGKATNRTESRALTGMTDADVRDALREADRITTSGRAPSAPPDEAEGV